MSCHCRATVGRQFQRIPVLCSYTERVNIHRMAAHFFLFMVVIHLVNPARAQLASTAVTSDLTFLHPTYDVAFVWESGRKGSRPDPHAALLIPVSLPQSNRTYYMQLDTGSPVSMLYREICDRIGLTDSGTNPQTVSLTLGNRELVLKNPRMINRVVTPATESTQPLIIGTFGTDLLVGKLVWIDYPNRQLQLLDEVPKTMQPEVKWSPLLVERGSVLFPARIQGQAKLLYWDTGSSSFALLTDEKSFSRLAASDSASFSYPVNSWNRVLTAHTTATTDSIHLANHALPIGQVSYMEGATDSQVNRMMALGIGGLTGNQLFLRSVLLIDARNKRYSILPR